jgi:hypothetical protein
MVRSGQHLVQPQNWRTTPCRLSATAYSIYSQLPSMLEAVPPSATWGRAMPWWQGLTDHGVLCTLLTEMSEFLTKSARKHISSDQSIGTANVMDAVCCPGCCSAPTSALPLPKALNYIHTYFPDLSRTTYAFPNFCWCHTIVKICSFFFVHYKYFFFEFC